MSVFEIDRKAQGTPQPFSEPPATALARHIVRHALLRSRRVGHAPRTRPSRTTTTLTVLEDAQEALRRALDDIVTAKMALARNQRPRTQRPRPAPAVS
jgi:hypothetical protein